MEETIQSEIITPPDHSIEKRRAITLMFVVAPLMGLEPLLPSLPGQILFILLGTLIPSLAMTWIYFDSVELERPIGTGTRVAVFFFTSLVIPYYLFRSRGFLSGWASVFKATGLGLVLLTIFLITFLITALIAHLISPIPVSDVTTGY